MNNQFIKEVREYVSLCQEVKKIEEGLGSFLGRLFGSGYTDGAKQVLGKMQDVYKSDNALINQARDILVRTLERRQKTLAALAPKLIKQIEDSNAEPEIVQNVKNFIKAKSSDVSKSIKVIQNAIQQIKTLGEPVAPTAATKPATDPVDPAAKPADPAATPTDPAAKPVDPAATPTDPAAKPASDKKAASILAKLNKDERAKKLGDVNTEISKLAADPANNKDPQTIIDNLRKIDKFKDFQVTDDVKHALYIATSNDTSTLKEA
jgi:hypothetical protein